MFTDASDQTAAAVLTQEYADNDGEVKEMPIAYLSAEFSDTQFKWSTVVRGLCHLLCNKEMETLP